MLLLLLLLLFVANVDGGMDDGFIGVSVGNEKWLFGCVKPFVFVESNKDNLLSSFVVVGSTSSGTRKAKKSNDWKHLSTRKKPIYSYVLLNLSVLLLVSMVNHSVSMNSVV